jgi:hypothetical protein
MNRHEFLHVVHTRFQPRNYLEIGINKGQGLALSTTRTIGVDPEFGITEELACDLKLVKATSDDFFARADAISWFPEGIIDLTFIDGLHLFEYALRDFMNAERLSAPLSVVVFDDVLPRSVEEAARDRHTGAWAGDTYKVILALERYRPDLVIVPLDTRPTGLLLVLGLDPTSTVLADHYDEIMAQYVVGDPQSVPDAILNRQTAADPQLVADSPVWPELAAARDSGAAVDFTADLRSLRGSARPWRPAPIVRFLRRVNPGLERRLRRLVREGS